MKLHRILDAIRAVALVLTCAALLAMLFAGPAHAEPTHAKGGNGHERASRG